MAILPDNERVTVWAQSMREFPGETSLTKAQLRAAVDALDSWVDSNAAAINAAIPQPARSSLTSQQKSFLLALVLQRRYGANV